MSALQEISMRSKKEELLNAYLMMKEKFEEKQNNQLSLAQVEEQKKEENQLLEKTKSYLPEFLDSEISSLAKSMQTNLFDMRDKIVAKSEKLKELRDAINTESCRLEEIYNIKLAANTLQVIIADFNQKNQEIEKQKKEEEIFWEDIKMQKKRDWKREQEEYDYHLKIEREKEQNEYAVKQEKEQAKWQNEIVEKENKLSEREILISKKESEIEEMRKKIEQIPMLVEKTSKETKEKIEEKMKDDFAVQKLISQQKWESEKNIFEAKIQNEQEFIKNQTIEIATLRKALAEANLRIQNLAMAALSSASNDIHKNQQEHIN